MVANEPPGRTAGSRADPAAACRAERAALSDLLLELGPDAPTLCEGWTTRDMAAHLVLRDRRPDAMPGITVGALAGYTERVRRSLARRPYAELVLDLREGPPRLSVWSLPKLSGTPNLMEYLVHHEDVRRAQPAWAPRELPPGVQRLVWSTMAKLGRVLYRRSRPGVVLGNAGEEVRVRPGEPAVTVDGAPLEQLLHAFGRRSHALVDVRGPQEALDAFAGTPLGA